MRVLIVEDQTLFRQLLRKLCIEESSCIVVGEAGTVEEGRAAIREAAPDLIILDLHFASGDGFELIEFARSISSHAKILVISAHADTASVRRLRGLNIAGFVEKNTNSIVTVTLALHAIVKGETFFCDTYRRAEAAQSEAGPRPAAIFSRREMQILALIGEAASDSEIGRSLGITTATAQTYRSQIMRKVGVSSTPRLMRFALEQGIARLAVPRIDEAARLERVRIDIPMAEGAVDGGGVPAQH